VTMKSLTENFDLGTKEGRFMFAVLAAAAEYELELRAERQAEGIAAARRRQAEGTRGALRRIRPRMRWRRAGCGSACVSSSPVISTGRHKTGDQGRGDALVAFTAPKRDRHRELAESRGHPLGASPQRPSQVARPRCQLGHQSANVRPARSRDQAKAAVPGGDHRGQEAGGAARLDLAWQRHTDLVMGLAAFRPALNSAGNRKKRVTPGT